MLHEVRALCVAHDLHMIALRALERTCWRHFAAQLGDCTKSRIAPLNAIIIIVVVVVVITGELLLHANAALFR